MGARYPAVDVDQGAAIVARLHLSWGDGINRSTVAVIAIGAVRGTYTGRRIRARRRRGHRGCLVGWSSHGAYIKEQLNASGWKRTRATEEQKEHKTVVPFSSSRLKELCERY